jgi:hypothetical protein
MINTIFFSNDLQIQRYDLTYASASFESILFQALYQLGGFRWSYGDPVFTRAGIQQSINITKGRSGPLLIVFSRPCERTCEAKESVLVHALRYITYVLGYKIYDPHFAEYAVKRHQVLGG